MTTALTDLLDFALPAELEAREPAEARGLRRDDVRLMVSYRSTDRVAHSYFRDLPSFLRAGDILVINTSKTINAALPALRPDGVRFELHLSTHLPSGEWVVELRTLSPKGTKPFWDAHPGDTLKLPEDGAATLLAPYGRAGESGMPSRLWRARLEIPGALDDYLWHFGFPIRYGYVSETWPLSYYQNVYATEPGSAEMPSAGRAFTPELITRLVAQGVQIAPLILHTGVASLEAYEPPYPEYYRVSVETAQRVNLARSKGWRVIAVGTTVIRTLETVTDGQGQVHPGEGWTSLVITPDHKIRLVDALLTGLHEPKASHLAMLESLAGRSHLQITYEEALKRHYLWHEFGDLHLILP
ncbi:MAG TPA: S-adenosylmethionine:tRNA ribosyltransferase-isomerase [Aggregatilineales bacterium]|nr:S-adenosylmethionine:tRNA ribosyltransferase-isomerase [Aggregatilineales bacterium]